MLRRKRPCLALELLETRALASDTLVSVACAPRGVSAPGAFVCAASGAGLVSHAGTTPGARAADHAKAPEKPAAPARRVPGAWTTGQTTGRQAPSADPSWVWPEAMSLDLAPPPAGRHAPAPAVDNHPLSPPDDRGAGPQAPPDAGDPVAAAQPLTTPRAATDPWTDLGRTATLTLTTRPGVSAGHAADPGINHATPPPTGGDFQVSWYSGTYDPAGRFMGATEVMQLVAYKGMLFAGTSSWADVSGSDPVVGAQVLRLDGPHDAWRRDADFSELLPDGSPRYVRIGAMKAVTFTHDGDGHPLPEPVSMLLAAPSDQLGVDAVYSRDDDTGTWTPMALAENPIPGGIRALGFYQDSVTGLERVFAGSAAAGLFSGVYDPQAPGRIRWEPVPELVPYNRFMAFAQADGAFYTVVQPAAYRRQDGPQPGWDTVYTYPPPPVWASGLRGLTTIANPTGSGDALLTGKEGLVSLMQRFDPQTDFRPVTELYVQNFLRQHWGSGFSLTGSYLVLGYNDMPQYTDPRTHETVNLITMLAQSPNPDQAHSAWFLVRHANAQYDLHEVRPLPVPNNPDPSLRATRSIVASPFPEDQGRVFYLCGYDVSEQWSHNTGWVYRGSLAAVLGDQPGGQRGADQ